MMPKLQKMVGVLQKASAPPPELALLEELLDAPDDFCLHLDGKALKGNHSRVQLDHCQCPWPSEQQAGGKPQGEEAQSIEKLRALYRTVLRLNAEEYEIIKKSPLQSIAAGIVVTPVNQSADFPDVRHGLSRH